MRKEIVQSIDWNAVVPILSGKLQKRLLREALGHADLDDAPSPKRKGFKRDDSRTNYSGRREFIQNGRVVRPGPPPDKDKSSRYVLTKKRLAMPKDGRAGRARTGSFGATYAPTAAYRGVSLRTGLRTASIAALELATRQQRRSYAL